MYSVTMKKTLSLLVAFAMVLGMAAMALPMQAKAATVDIAVSNGDFENGAFGGAVNGSNGASIVEKATYEGNYALKFDATGEILTVTGYLAEATTAESTVTLSFWAKVLAGSTQNSVNFGLFATNESWGNRVQQYGAGYPIVGGEWKQISQALSVPAGTKIIQAQIYLGATGAIAIIDNVSITDGNGNEILHSGGFEKGILNDDFNANDALEIVCTPVHGGNYAAHADKSAGNGNISTTVTFDPSSEARTMTFSYWMYAPTSANGAHNMVVCFDTSSGNWTNLSTKYGAQYATPGVWVQKTMEIAVAANTNTLQIQLYAQDAGADFYIDDLTLTEDVVEIVNHEATLGLNVVTGDGTWQLGVNAATQIPTNYYKIPATIDGVACNVLAQYNGDIFIIYPNFFPALGGAVPTGRIIVAEGAVLKAVDSANGWAEIKNADTVTVTEKLDLSFADGAWNATINNQNVTIGLNQVTGDGTWQFAISEMPAEKYYKVPAIIDGVESTFVIGIAGDIMCAYPNFFGIYGGTAPMQQVVIAEGAVLKAVDSANGWQEIADACTLTLTEKIDVSYADGAWSDTVYNTNVTMSLNQVTGDGTWQFAISEAPNDTYYKVPAIIDGVECNFLMGKAGDVMCVYPDFFTALGGKVPTQQIIIAEGAVLKAVDSANGWCEIEDTYTLTMTEKIDLSFVNGVWGETSYTVDVSAEFSQVTGDGTWQLGLMGENIAAGYYKIPVSVDGVACSILAQYTGDILVVYPNFFTAVGGMVPNQSLKIAENANLVKVDANNGWQAEEGAKTLVLTQALSVENILGKWLDMSQYANVTFTELSASNLNVYRVEDQSAEQQRSTFAISSDVAIGNEGWANFTKVAFKVLVDGVATDAVFGMVPATDSSWAAESAFLLYVTGEGYRDAATAASSVTICAGTMIISPVDNTKGFLFTEDFVMYKNEDGSWDTTEDPTVEKQEITLGMNTVTGDGTWQLSVSGEEIPVGYYKFAATVDGNACNVLAQYNGSILIIYPNFFLGGAAPAESFVIAAGATLKSVDPNNGWAELGGTPVVLTSELKAEYIMGKWYETSKYADVNFTEIYAADLDLYYYNITRLGDYSDWELKLALMQYPEYQSYLDYYGRQANLTTFGIKSTIPTLQIPNDAAWSTFTVIGKVSVDGAEPMETFVMQTPDSSDDSQTAMDNAFLIQFRNGFVGDDATSITIEPGTKIITKDGIGFVFVDGYTLYRDSDGNWSDVVPAGTNPVNKWGLTLGEYVGVNFKMNVNTTDVVSFAVNGNAVSAVQNGNVYTISLAAAQMNDEITVYVNGVAQDKTYSVRGYAEIILADSGYAESTHNLVKAMLIYGGASQTNFGYHTDNLASAGVEMEAQEPAGSSEVAVTDNLSGINYYGASLVYEHNTAVRFYFSGDVAGLTFQVGENTYTAVEKGELYYIEVADINPQDLGDEITVVVSDGNNTLTVSYAPLTYIVRMYNKAESSAATKAVVKALYNYYLAAVAYTA